MQVGRGVTNSTPGCVTAKHWEWWMKVQMTARPGLQAQLSLAFPLSLAPALSLLYFNAPQMRLTLPWQAVTQAGCRVSGPLTVNHQSRFLPASHLNNKHCNASLPLHFWGGEYLWFVRNVDAVAPVASLYKRSDLCVCACLTACLWACAQVVDDLIANLITHWPIGLHVTAITNGEVRMIEINRFLVGSRFCSHLKVNDSTSISIWPSVKVSLNTTFHHTEQGAVVFEF